MKYCFITVPTLTAAQMAESQLRRNGLQCRIQRSPKWMEEQGCGNGIMVAFDVFDKCITVLKNNRIPYKKVYLKDESGKMEVLEL